jgi:hypothetical protein
LTSEGEAGADGHVVRIGFVADAEHVVRDDDGCVVDDDDNVGVTLLVRKPATLGLQ